MYYFIGIKGTGMAALAEILFDEGNQVMGSDLDKHFFTEKPLIEKGIKILPFDPQNIKDNYTVIIGNAFADDFPEVKAALSNKTVKCYRYHVFLGMMLEKYISIGVAGSHGKTTTTGMTKSLLSCYYPTGYLIGDGDGYLAKDSKYFVLEADEYRRHFCAYHPDYALVTNVDIDHIDYFKDEADYRSAYDQFLSQVKKMAFVNGDDSQARLLKPNSKIVWFGLQPGNDIQAINVKESAEDISYNVLMNGKDVGHFSFPFVGHHLVYDSLAVVCFGLELGLTPSEIEAGLSTFTGVKRRFVIEEYHGSIFVDDYAHHPTEVKTTLETARKRWPDKKIVAVFKPHRVSRVKYFAQQFADALSIADKVGVCDFTSIDDFEPGINITIEYLSSRIKDCKVYQETEEDAKELALEAPCVYVFMSSKDIYPFKEKVKKYL